jgi:hypothetical protein
VRDHVLHLARMLGGGEDLHAAVLARNCERDLAFKIEMVLAARANGAPQPMRRARQRGRRIAARDVGRRKHVRLGGHGVVDGQDRRQRLESSPASFAAPREAPVRRRHGKLPGEFDDLARENRIVVLMGRRRSHGMSAAVTTATTRCVTHGRSSRRSLACAMRLTPTATWSMSAARAGRR